MIVVADSSPLQYLIPLELPGSLQQLYGHVFLPDVVAGELRALPAPKPVRGWMSHPTAWIEVASVDAADVASVADSLDRGERDGTPGVLRAAEHGLIDVPDVLARSG